MSVLNIQVHKSVLIPEHSQWQLSISTVVEVHDLSDKLVKTYYINIDARDLIHLKP